jgi:hypothetical protein
VQARERTLTRSGESRRPSEQATAAALLTTAQSCCYCHQDHSSNTCKTVVDVSSRRQILRRAGRCFVCLRKGHLARDCRSAGKCHDCKGRHHVSLCTAKSGSLVRADSGRPSTNQPTPLNPEAPTYAPSNPTVRNETTSTLWTFSNKEVLLQTAQVSVFNPNEKMNLTMFTVPSICEPIHGQPIVHYQELYPHLNGLDLADNIEEASPREIDVLVGSNFYWDLITGQIRQGSTGPVAIHTRIGWVLSGPHVK